MSEPPTQPPAVARERRSVVIVNTGDGKGKSTAAFGTTMRAVAAGWRVAVVQFVKSDKWKVGEEKTSRTIGVDWWTIGEGFSWDSEDLSRDEAMARAAWAHAATVIAGGAHGLVVLDEITYPMNWGWIDTATVVTAIRERPQLVSVIATGRDAPDALLAVADTVTEMRKLRHAYDAGVAAQRGIDY